MNILLISYGNIGFDGRLRSLINVFSEIGEVHSFTRGNAPLNEISRVSNSPYLKFIVESIRFAKGLEKIDWLVLDNRKATIPGLIIQKKYHPTVTIQDCRELYLIKEVKHFAGKIGCIFERMMVKRADTVICANHERAIIMQQEYCLKKEPLTYENLRQLQYGSDEEMEAARRRINPFILNNEWRIISSSGCSAKRTNDVLVKNLSKVEKKCRLFLVGDSTSEEVEMIKKIIRDQNLGNVEIVGRLNQTELKYLISHCHIGIVNYGQYDTNNKLCASGKLYEFLYEGLPVVTTTNDPLKRMCDDYLIGVSDDKYAGGINDIINNYETYKNNVAAFSAVHTIENNDSEFIKNLLCETNSARNLL